MPNNVLPEQHPARVEPPVPHQGNEGPNQNDAPPGDPNTTYNTYKKKANINIATLNVKGATAPSHNMNLTEKWSTINHTIRTNKIAILALQETHLDEELASEINRCFHRSFDLHYSYNPNNPRGSAGVAFVINKALISPKHVTVQALIPGRVIVLTIAWSGTQNTTIMNVYAPVDRQKQPDLWAQTERRRSRARIPHPDFVLGDFNLTEDPIDRVPPRLDNRAAVEALRNIRHAWELQDHWRHAYPNDRIFTYRAPHENDWIHSRLDRIYAARKHVPTLFEWKAGPTAMPTDHWMVTVKFAPNDAPDIGNGRWTWPLQSLNDTPLLGKIIKRGMIIQEKLEKLEREGTNRNESNPQLL